MAISEQPTQVCTLSVLPVGSAATIVALEGPAAKLAEHGLRPGVVVRVERDGPFHGPRIVQLGAARIAIARSVAEAVRVRPVRPDR